MYEIVANLTVFKVLSSVWHLGTGWPLAWALFSISMYFVHSSTSFSNLWTDRDTRIKSYRTNWRLNFHTSDRQKAQFNQNEHMYSCIFHKKCRSIICGNKMFCFKPMTIFQSISEEKRSNADSPGGVMC